MAWVAMANMGAQVATQANGTRRQKVSTQVHAGQLEKVREEVPNITIIPANVHIVRESVYTW